MTQERRALNLAHADNEAAAKQLSFSGVWTRWSRISAFAMSTAV